MIPLLIYLTLIVSQVIPTFGNQLGVGGTGIPLFIALGGYALVFLAALSRAIPRKFFMNTTLYLFVGASFGIFTTVLSPFLSSYRDASIVIKAIVMYLAVLAGFLLYKDDRDFKNILTFLVCLFVLHIALFIDHINDPNGPIQGLYNFKNYYGAGYHKNRFPGTWGFPYPEALFLTSCSFSFIFFSIKSKSHLLKIVFVLMAIGGLYMSVFGTQSRANMASLILSLGYGTCVYFLFSINSNKGRHVMTSLSIASMVIFGIVVFISALYNPAVQSEYGHLTNIDRVINNIGSFNRVNDLWVLLDFISNDPIRLFIGFGGARSMEYTQIYLESILNYIFNYGLIGFFLIMGPWFVLWFKSLGEVFVSRSRNEYMPMIFLHVFLSYTFLMCMSADMFTHYRFIPFYYLLLGMYYKRQRLMKAGFAKNT